MDVLTHAKRIKKALTAMDMKQLEAIARSWSGNKDVDYTHVKKDDLVLLITDSMGITPIGTRSEAEAVLHLARIQRYHYKSRRGAEKALNRHIEKEGHDYFLISHADDATAHWWEKGVEFLAAIDRRTNPTPAHYRIVITSTDHRFEKGTK